MLIILDSLTLILLVLGWWAAIASYPALPETIPVHFGWNGRADGWGGRWMIFLMPVIATLIVALNGFVFTKLTGSPKMPAAMALPLHLMTLELAALFAYITWRMCEVAFERAEGLGTWFVPVVMLATMGTGAWMVIAGKTH